MSWISFAAIFALSVVPASVRPVVAPQSVEHALAFTAAGTLFAIAHELTLARVISAAVTYTFLIETVQIGIPGRHARLSDFLVDAAAAVVGGAIGYIFRQATRTMTWRLVRLPTEPPRGKRPRVRTPNRPRGR
jgi:VanZ family protein